VSLRIPLFFGIGGCKGMAICRPVLWCYIDGFHDLARLDLWPDGVIIASRRRQRRLLTCDRRSAFHPGKYKVILCYNASLLGTCICIE
jgi:hypothetical protein